MQFIRSHHKLVAAYFALGIATTKILIFLYCLFVNHYQIAFNTDHAVEIIDSLLHIILLAVLSAGGLMVVYKEKNEYIKILIFGFGMCVFCYGEQLGYAISSGSNIEILYYFIITVGSGIITNVLRQVYIG